MKNIKVVILSILFFSISNYSNNLENVFYDIVNYYNSGNSEIYKYIDMNNETMYKKFRSNIGKGNVEVVGNINYKNVGDKYIIGTLMSGSGKIYNSRWSFNEMFITYTFVRDDNKDTYILVDTDFFDKSGIDVIRSSYSDLFINALTISFLIFMIMLLVSYKIYRRALKDNE